MTDPGNGPMVSSMETLGTLPSDQVQEDPEALERWSVPLARAHAPLGDEQSAAMCGLQSRGEQC